MVAVVVIVTGAGDNDGAQAVWLAMVAIRRGLWLSEHWPVAMCQCNVAACVFVSQFGLHWKTGRVALQSI